MTGTVISDAPFCYYKMNSCNRTKNNLYRRNSYRIISDKADKLEFKTK